MKTRLGLVILLSLGGILLVCQQPSFAGVEGVTFAVTSTADLVDDNPGDGVCSTVFGVCTLRAAIMETNALVGADNITMPAGTYLLSIAGTGENACLTGDLDIVDDLTITGAGASTTIIDANQLDRALHIFTGITVTISDLTVQNGNLPTGQSGGGGISANGILYLSRVVITNNLVNGTLTPDVGGGILAVGGPTDGLYLEDSTISNNYADRGGGIFANHTLYITNTLIYSNSANGGGGLLNYAQAWLTNVTLSGNIAPGSNGGNMRNSAAATLVNVTIANSPDGGGLTNDVPITLINTILAGNSPDNCRIFTSITSDGYNLDSDDTCGLSDVTDLVSVDPLLAPLADNGGPTWTHALGQASPALDGVVAGYCPPTDQRGFMRPIDGNEDGNPLCDIGAFEAGIIRYLPLVLRNGP